MKQITDEEFTDLVGLEWSIWRADESGWPLLSPGCPHWQNPLLASASFSSVVPYEPGCFVLAKESWASQSASFLLAELEPGPLLLV